VKGNIQCYSTDVLLEKFKRKVKKYVGACLNVVVISPSIPNEMTPSDLENHESP